MFRVLSFFVRLERRIRIVTMAAATPAAPMKVAKKKTAPSKAKKVANHPTYAAMINDALTNLKVYFVTF